PTPQPSSTLRATTTTSPARGLPRLRRATNPTPTSHAPATPWPTRRGTIMHSPTRRAPTTPMPTSGATRLRTPTNRAPTPLPPPRTRRATPSESHSQQHVVGRGRRRGQCTPQRARLGNRLTTPIALEDLPRPRREHAPNLATHPLHPRDPHLVVAGGLVTHPGDHRGLGTLLDRDALRASDRATSDLGRMRRDDLRQTTRDLFVARIEREKREHAVAERPRVLGFLRLATRSRLFEPAMIPRIATLAGELRPNALDPFRRRPHPA